MYAKTFDNAYYSAKWQEKVPGTDRLYRQGTYSRLNDGGWAVYDGAENLMGFIYDDGNFEVSGDPTLYKATFIAAAAAAIQAEEGGAEGHD